MECPENMYRVGRNRMVTGQVVLVKGLVMTAVIVRKRQAVVQCRVCVIEFMCEMGDQGGTEDRISRQLPVCATFGIDCS